MLPLNVWHNHPPNLIKLFHQASTDGPFITQRTDRAIASLNNLIITCLKYVTTRRSLQLDNKMIVKPLSALVLHRVHQRYNVVIDKLKTYIFAPNTNQRFLTRR